MRSPNHLALALSGALAATASCAAPQSPQAPLPAKAIVAQDYPGLDDLEASERFRASGIREKLVLLTRGQYDAAIGKIAETYSVSIPSAAFQGFNDPVTVREVWNMADPKAQALSTTYESSRNDDGSYPVASGVTLHLPDEEKDRKDPALCVSPERLGGKVPERWKCISLDRGKDGFYTAQMRLELGRLLGGANLNR